MDETPQKKKRLWARIGLVRLIVFFAVLYAGEVGGFLALQQLKNALPKDLLDPVLLAAAVLIGLVVLGLYWLLVRWLERRPVKELALPRGIPLALAGMLLAVAILSAFFGILWLAGATGAPAFGGTKYSALFAVIAIVSGVSEELAFRGGVYRILEDSFGSLVAVVVSGVIFGAMHFYNPDAGIFSSVAVAVEGGIMMGAAYAATRSLWLLIGIHIGWNFTEGGIFGAAVSGGAHGKGILNIPLSGPDWLTGGPFGPEASIVTMALCVLVGTIFVVMAVRRRRWMPLSFRMVLD